MGGAQAQESLANPSPVANELYQDCVSPALGHGKPPESQWAGQTTGFQVRKAEPLTGCSILGRLPTSPSRSFLICETMLIKVTCMENVTRRWQCPRHANANFSAFFPFNRYFKRLC